MLENQAFHALGISPKILSAILETGYQEPTPIQGQCIPIFMRGEDVVAQAQTGTGKTAAFAWPILSGLNIAKKETQALIITPTRELAIQVSEAFQRYAKYMDGVLVIPIYGGQDYQIQLRALKRGPQVIIGTPGRVMDHLRRGTLSTNALKTVVLDEADEMLKMGFIDDIQWILEQIPHAHQTALFSATMPEPIQKIAKRYLKEPKKIHIKATQTTTVDIDQYYLTLAHREKLGALARFLDVEDVDAAIVFARTKMDTEEIADKLKAQGFLADALNGDMKQSAREKIIKRVKDGSLNIIVATDVAARGIDLARITHVFNYDIPHDPESYTHRIGRTGRAGRSGRSILFVTPKEQRSLRDIENTVQKPIKKIDVPTYDEVVQKRAQLFTAKIMKILKESKDLPAYRKIIDDIVHSGQSDPRDVAAALACFIQHKEKAVSVVEVETVGQESHFKENYKPRRKPQSRRFDSNGGGNNGGDRSRSSHPRSKKR